ncbi:hypothetical protein Raf01_01130 [Rugosimonospora africana]|uniref:Uncharacterized protein n=1 Tax=Rugosimonospora africana TaxID=556532 RepID=A0A8J3QJX1_9ACTN|nr:hypothetical protein Raf01_01130 [Rugosimonospora africana]
MNSPFRVRAGVTITVSFREEGAVEDFIYVVLTLVLFALLALVVRAVEKL